MRPFARACALRTKTDRSAAALLQKDLALRQPAGSLPQIAGVGEKTAVSLLSEMPELGTLKPGQAAALAGGGALRAGKRTTGKGAND